MARLLSMINIAKMRKNNPVKALLIDKKAWRKKNHVLFNLTAESINIPTVCPVLGIPLIWGGGITSHNSPSLDRFDPNAGYTIKNVRVISWGANNLKSNGTMNEFELILQYFYQNSKVN